MHPEYEHNQPHRQPFDVEVTKSKRPSTELSVLRTVSTFSFSSPNKNWLLHKQR